MTKISDEEIRKLKLKANEIRTWSIKMIYAAQSGHPGGALSAADILAVLYFHEMRVDPNNPEWEDRDRFVLSKGHASAAYYAALAMRGFFPEDELLKFRRVDSFLQGHPSLMVPGVDMCTGSLGQGLSAAIGMALAAKMDGKDYRVYAILGDGEIEEGNIWEAAMTAATRKLDNLVAIVDRNKIQLDDFTDTMVALDPLEEKWRGFGWRVISINGHDMVQIIRALDEARGTKGRPTVIIAHTVKGKGVSYMENTAKYHGKPPQSEEEYEMALKELNDERRRI
ncbi:transketolase, beta subunit [Aciduliprofundum sp. MAR08-339]|uniref:transketolase n=1 Tax=Aciduliprofundum sp. (strain MAR08-339) TaxID=673860 RepID=UPI0002A4C5FF|nr:transketolase, beta subunit [Aciduliprofundum sp. MAR08-339]